MTSMAGRLPAAPLRHSSCRLPPEHLTRGGEGARYFMPARRANQGTTENGKGTEARQPRGQEAENRGEEADRRQGRVAVPASHKAVLAEGHGQITFVTDRNPG